MKTLNEMELDALKEVGNIGAGNAATSMAEMTSMKIDITVPKVILEAINTVPEKLGGAKKQSVAIYFEIEGDLNGNLILFLPVDGSTKLIDLMMYMDPGTTIEIDEMGQSALMEMGNILASSYLNALAGLTGTYLLPSPPNYSMDSLENIIDNIMEKIGSEVEQTIFIETDFTATSVNVGGGLVFLLTQESISKLFEIFGLI